MEVIFFGTFFQLTYGKYEEYIRAMDDSDERQASFYRDRLNFSCIYDCNLRWTNQSKIAIIHIDNDYHFR